MSKKIIFSILIGITSLILIVASASVYHVKAIANGVCGVANGVGSTTNLIPANNLCSSGTPSAVTSDNDDWRDNYTYGWQWTCTGSEGGATAQCSAPINGACGPSVKGLSAVTPYGVDYQYTNFLNLLCMPGTPSYPISGSGPWTWTCAGSAGGTTATCLAPYIKSCYYNDVGLRAYNGTEKIIIATEPEEGVLTSPLRISRSDGIHGIVLIDPGGSNDSGIRIKTNSGIKALQKCTPKFITFSFVGQNPLRSPSGPNPFYGVVDGIINETNHTITLTVPYGTDVTTLVPNIEGEVAGSNIFPSPGVAHDFTNPSIYTLTPSYGPVKNYTVIVNVASSSTKAITSFNFYNDISPHVIGTINETNHTVTLNVPYGTNLTALTPTIEIAGSSVSPAIGVVNNFTNPSIYTVTAPDGTTQNYTVTATFSCGGYLSNGHCWYLGDEAQSCNDVCSMRGSGGTESSRRGTESSSCCEIDANCAVAKYLIGTSGSCNNSCPAMFELITSSYYSCSAQDYCNTCSFGWPHYKRVCACKY